MKTTKILFASLITIFVIAATSCKKEEKNTSSTPNPTTTQKFFTINSGTVVNSSFPSASTNAPATPIINGNATILEGGSNNLTIEAPSNATNVLIGVKGYSGYYKVPVINGKGQINITLLFPSDLPTQRFEIIVAISDANNNISLPANIPVSVHQAGTGKLQVSCSWNRLNDVDLHLVQPDGEEIYYSHESSAVGGILDVDSNPGCNLDSINNENITYADTAKIISGEYIVRVDFYSNCGITENTYFTTTARYNGQLITPTSGQNAYNGFFLPDSSDHGGLGSGREIMRFKIDANPAKNNKKIVSFRFPQKITRNKYGK